MSLNLWGFSQKALLTRLVGKTTDWCRGSGGLEGELRNGRRKGLQTWREVAQSLEGPGLGFNPERPSAALASFLTLGLSPHSFTPAKRGDAQLRSNSGGSESLVKPCGPPLACRGTHATHAVPGVCPACDPCVHFSTHGLSHNGRPALLAEVSSDSNLVNSISDPQETDASSSQE